MLDLAEPSTPEPFDLQTIDERSDDELDALPFGVICLDEEGTILRYNLYESRFARLDRNTVIGRTFFGEVAPCARTEAFEGRFRAFLARGGAGTERFDFLFDFKFGAQQVSIELVKAPGAARYYLLVNRVKLMAPRPSFPAELLAAEQRVLAPDEAKRGVRRDDLERRFVDAPASLFAALRATCDRLAPESWQLFATEWGVQWGRRAAVDLEASALETRQVSLRDLTMREASALVAGYLLDRGWGRPTFDFSATNEGVLVIDLERSALAEAAPRRRGPDGAPRPELGCPLVAGCFSGILTSLAGRRLAAREVACVAGGAPQCSFVVVAHERRAVIDGALRDGARGTALIRDALRRAPRSGAPSR
ncbi:MAG: V4R domain-containing protein [Byssovorax sp.]